MLSILFLLTGILGIAGLFNFIQSKFKERNFGPFSILVFSMALTPPIYSFILWFFMLIFPGKISATAYVSGLFCLNIIMCTVFFMHIKSWLNDLKQYFFSFIERHEIKKGALFILAGCVFLCWIVLLFFAFTNHLRNFDVIEYVLGGDFFAKSRAVKYDGWVINPENGFLLRTFHSFIFPLFGTLGVFFQSTIGTTQDFYFKYLNYHYFLTLNCCILFYLCSRLNDKKSIYIPLCCLMIFNSVPVTLDFLYFYGIDFFRITMLLLFIYVLSKYVQKPARGMIFFLIMTASFAMLAHGLQVFAVLWLSLSVFFADCSWKRKITDILLLGFGYLVFGLSHYVATIFWGDGWLYKLISAAVASTSAAGCALVSSKILNIETINLIGVAYIFVLLLPLLLLYCLIKYKKIIFWNRTEKILFFLVYCLQILLITYLRMNFRYLYTFIPLILLLFFDVLLTFKFNRKQRLLLITASVFLVFVSVLCVWLLFSTKKVKPKQVAKDIVNYTAEVKHTNRDNFQKKIKTISGRIVFMGKNKKFYRMSTVPTSYCGVDRLSGYVIFTDGTVCNVTEKNCRSKFLDHFDYVVIVEPNNLPDKIGFIFDAVRKNGVLIALDDTHLLYKIDKAAQGEKDDK